MYSWNSRNVPVFTLMNASKNETPDIQQARSSVWKFGQELPEGLFSPFG
jgi:hypothetical protein